MKDNIDNSGNGFFGTSVTSWCSPPNGPPKSKKTRVPKDKAAELGLIKEAGSHGAFSDNKSRWTYPPTAPPQSAENVKAAKVKAVPANHNFSEDFEGIPEPWTTGPPKKAPKNNVIPLEQAEIKKWREEIKEIESHFDPKIKYTIERQQLLVLLANIVENKMIPMIVRKEALQILLNQSTIRQLICNLLKDCSVCETSCKAIDFAHKGFDLVDKAISVR